MLLSWIFGRDRLTWPYWLRNWLGGPFTLIELGRRHYGQEWVDMQIESARMFSDCNQILADMEGNYLEGMTQTVVAKVEYREDPACPPR